MDDGPRSVTRWGRGSTLLAAFALMSCTADIGDGPTGHVIAADSNSPGADHELAVVRAVLARQSVFDVRAQRPFDDSPGSLNAYYRAVCSTAFSSALVRAADGERWTDSDFEIDYLEAAADDFAYTTQLGDPAWWLAPAVGLDCLLAASAAASATSGERPERLAAVLRRLASLTRGLANRMVAPAAPTSLAHYRELQALDRGNSMAEEVGLAGSFLFAAATLLDDATDEERQAWRSRAAELIGYSSSDAGQDSPFEPGAALVNNHGMSPHPLYTLSLLTSYAEISAVAQQSGVDTDADFLPASERTGAIAEALAGFTLGSELPPFALRGSFEDLYRGTRNDYADLTYTIANPSSGSQLSIPTSEVGALSLYRDLGGVVHGYVVRDDRLWKYVCPPGMPCEASHTAPLSTQWQWVAEHERYGDNPLPTSDLQAMTQVLWPDGRLHSYLYQGGLRWSYLCADGSCRADEVTSLSSLAGAVRSSERFAEPLPTSEIRTASHYYDPGLGQVRVYWMSADRVWHFRCTTAIDCEAIYDSSIADLFKGIQGQEQYGAHAMPTRDIRALAQFFDAEGALQSYVFAGDRVWTYRCAADGCSARYTASLTDHFRAVSHQERWANDLFEVHQGVSDWGFDATIQDSAYVYLAMRGDAVDRERHEQLVEAQRLRGLDRHPLFPHFDGARWSYDARAGEPDRAGRLRYLTDDWPSPGVQPTLDEQRYAHWWLNLLQAYNASVAFLLQTDAGYLMPLGE